MPFDLSLPPYDPFEINILGLRYHPDGPRASPQTFGIYVSEGTGVVVTEDFVDAIVGSPMISDRVIIKPERGSAWLKNGFCGNSISSPLSAGIAPRWNIIGTAKLKFWMCLAQGGGYVECRYHAAITNTHLSASSGGNLISLWIGSDTRRIRPSLDPRTVGYFVFQDQTYTTWHTIDSCLDQLPRLRQELYQRP